MRVTVTQANAPALWTQHAEGVVEGLTVAGDDCITAIMRPQIA